MQLVHLSRVLHIMAVASPLHLPELLELILQSVAFLLENEKPGSGITCCILVGMVYLRCECSSRTIGAIMTFFSFAIKKPDNV
jgi:hypothetical protein